MCLEFPLEWLHLLKDSGHGRYELLDMGHGPNTVLDKSRLVLGSTAKKKLD